MSLTSEQPRELPGLRFTPPLRTEHTLCISLTSPWYRALPSLVPRLLETDSRALFHGQTLLEAATILGCAISKERPSDLVKSGRGPVLHRRHRFGCWTSKDRLDFQAGSQEKGGPGVQESPAGRRLEGRGLQNPESTLGDLVIGAIAAPSPSRLGSCVLQWVLWSFKYLRGWDIVIGSIVLIYFSFEVILDL